LKACRRAHPADRHSGACVSRRDQIRASRRRKTAVLLVAMAGLAMPLVVRLAAEFSELLALVAPSVVLTAAICVICPMWIIPPAALAGLYAIEWAVLRGGPQHPLCPSFLQQVAEGRLELLWVPPLALATGYVLVYGRRRWQPRLLPPGFKTNLRVLGHRPARFAARYWLSLTALAVGAAMDMLSTIEFMLQAGPGLELHPAMRIMAEVFGVVPGVILGTMARLGFVVFVAAIWRRACAPVLWLCAVLYALAAMSNHFGWI